MLVLSRKQKEFINLRSDNGDTIRICVAEIKQGRVLLGIEADRRWHIAREEVDWGNHPIQAGLEQVADLGRRVFDPLGVADAYETGELLK
jgi:carbon storage regulator CsrA